MVEEKDKVNPEPYKKEFAFLDILQSRLNFGLFIRSDGTSRSVYCESCFYETMAWYIETQKEAHPYEWEEKVQSLINDILSHDNDIDRFKYIENFFRPIKIDWYKSHGWETNAKLLELREGEWEIWDRLWTPNDQGKIKGVLPGIVEPAIPQWYWTWFDRSELEKKVIAENRKNLINALRHGMNKAGN